MTNNNFTRYECPQCGRGGAGVPGQKYPCHRCGHKYMTAITNATKTTKSTSQNLEKP